MLIPFVLAVRAVLPAVVDLVNPYLGAVVAVEPVGRLAGLGPLLLVRAVLAVVPPVIDVIEGDLVTVAAHEGVDTNVVDVLDEPHHVVRPVFIDALEHPSQGHGLDGIVVRVVPPVGPVANHAEDASYFVLLAHLFFVLGEALIISHVINVPHRILHQAEVDVRAVVARRVHVVHVVITVALVGHSEEEVRLVSADLAVIVRVDEVELVEEA